MPAVAWPQSHAPGGHAAIIDGVTDLLSFVGLCLLITITPGLDTAVVIRNALRGGRIAGVGTAIGCAAGLVVHAALVAVGLGELLLHSEIAFQLVKFGGALVLIVLGARSLWSAWRAGRSDAVDVLPEPRRGGAPLVQGLLTNLMNPKATLFFLAALPQFVPADQPGRAIPVALGLAAIAVLFSFAGLTLVALGVHRIRHFLNSPKVRRGQETLLGATLVALGVRVATN